MSVSAIFQLRHVCKFCIKVSVCLQPGRKKIQKNKMEDDQENRDEKCDQEEEKNRKRGWKEKRRKKKKKEKKICKWKE